MERVKKQRLMVVKCFDPNVLKNEPVVAIIGRRNSGKTTLMSDLINKTCIPSVIMAGTEHRNDFFAENTNVTEIYNGYDEKALDDLINTQKKYRTSSLQKVGIVLDDCAYTSVFLKTDSLKSIFLNGRHWGISLMFGMQYCMSMSSIIESNIDYVFCFNDSIVDNQKRLYDKFGSKYFENFSDFQETFTQLTKDHGCMVISLNSTKIEDAVFYYKVLA